MVHASRLQQVVLGPQVLIYVRYQACPAQHWQLRRRRRLRHRCARHNPVGSYLMGAKTTPLSAACRPPAVTWAGPGTRVTQRKNLRTALARTVHARGIRTRPLSCTPSPPTVEGSLEAQKTRLKKKNCLLWRSNKKRREEVGQRGRRRGAQGRKACFEGRHAAQCWARDADGHDDAACIWPGVRHPGRGHRPRPPGLCGRLPRPRR